MPERQDRATVHRIIYEELVRGVVTDASRAQYRAIEEQYSDLPGYAETTDGELFPFGHGLTYENRTGTD